MDAKEESLGSCRVRTLFLQSDFNPVTESTKKSTVKQRQIDERLAETKNQPGRGNTSDGGIKATNLTNLLQACIACYMSELTAEVTLTTKEIAYLQTVLSVIDNLKIDAEPNVHEVSKSLELKLQTTKPTSRRGWPLSLSQTALWLLLLWVNLIAIAMQLN